MGQSGCLLFRRMDDSFQRAQRQYELKQETLATLKRSREFEQWRERIVSKINEQVSLCASTQFLVVFVIVQPLIDEFNEGRNSFIFQGLMAEAQRELQALVDSVPLEDHDGPINLMKRKALFDQLHQKLMRYLQLGVLILIC